MTDIARINRQKALAEGADRYIGKPCKRGHHSERRLNGNCIACEFHRQGDPDFVVHKREILQRYRAKRR